MIWYASKNQSQRRPGSAWDNLRGKRFSLDEPALTMMAAGMGGDALSHWHLYGDSRPERPTMMTNKPPYTPLTMAAVKAAPLTGLTHVSTFSGGGGSCLGFRLAGFRTLWANDLEEHARVCYRANLGAVIDGRDIRTITAAEILRVTRLAVGELDVFEGSPPCTAFSTAGKRAKGWGQTKDHAGHVQTNVEDLFFEWLRLLDGLRPRAFVAENVAGMVKGVSKGYFKDVLRRMKALGYRTAAQILDAQWLGVPQRRTRVIFIGMRDDLAREPTFPKPLAYAYSVRDALPWLTAALQDFGGQFAGNPEFIDQPCPTIIGAGKQAGRNAGHYLVQEGAFPKQWQSADQPSPVIMAGRITSIQVDPASRRGAPNNHDPNVDALPVALDRPSPVILASHAGRSDRAIAMPPCRQRSTGKAFMAQDVDPDGPSPAITRKGGTDLSLPDATVARRRFTMAELRRICSFPDDYVMHGTYTQQWARLGNSVPPLMAYAIAAAVRDTLRQSR